MNTIEKCRLEKIFGRRICNEGLFNNMYARDISKKVRAGMVQKQKKGFVMIPPLGYFKDKTPIRWLWSETSSLPTTKLKPVLDKAGWNYRRSRSRVGLCAANACLVPASRVFGSRWLYGAHRVCSRPYFPSFLFIG